MKRTAFFVSLLLLLLFACNTNNKRQQSVLTPNNLKSIFISLRADSAYNLKTPKGAILKIAKNSFSSSGKIQLEIKEAYSLQDILLAGLTTESNGKPLKSSGMIYVNATADGKVIKLLQPIKISIPAEVCDDKMQLFKGEIQSDSTINWVEPQPLDTSLTARKLLLGERLFKANCASCHKPAKDFTGPALAGCRERSPDRDWAYRFTRNPGLMITTDYYASRLYKKWKGNGLMTSFASLSKEDVHAILDYVDNEAALNPFTNTTTPMPGTADSVSSNKIKKPCGYDTVYYAKIDTSIAILPDNFDPIQVDTSYQNDIPYINDDPKDNPVTATSPLDFTYKSKADGMYDIEIKAFGWYNIDAFITAYTGMANVAVKVQLQMPVETDMNVFLLCPDKRLLTEAKDKIGSDFLFNETNGKIPLFLNDKAIIVAFGSKGDKMFYGSATFNIKEEQTTIITIKETTEAELKSFIQHNQIDGIKIDLNKKEDFNIIEKPCDGVYPIKTDTVVSVAKK
jgi:mono/diheme cytochrome c family protein